MNSTRLKPGDIVQHFKRETLGDNPGLLYLYEIIGFANHTETNEKLVVYKALYTDKDKGIICGQLFARPYEMFMSKVDKEKYPDIKQINRFRRFHKTVVTTHVLDDVQIPEVCYIPDCPVGKDNCILDAAYIKAAYPNTVYVDLNRPEHCVCYKSACENGYCKYYENEEEEGLDYDIEKG